MKTARRDDAPIIKKLFNAYPAEILTVPMGVILQSIAAGNMLWDNGVALMFRVCQKASYYGVSVGKGSYQILDIAASAKGDGSAARVLDEFCKEVQRPVFLLVKTDNVRGIRFYNRHNFKNVSTVYFPTFQSYLMVRDEYARR
jgi:ribosomal protein S18 acetylase RimI-like enzyme